MQLLVFAFFLAVSGSLGENLPVDECPFVFNIERSVSSRGFHRTVDYYFEVVSNGFIADCKVCLKQTIPTGLYVNKDQIVEMVRLKKLKASVEGSIDVEAPADKSSPHFVHLFADLIPSFNIFNATVSLPVHTRYHRAKKDGGFEEAILPTPEVFLSCNSLPSQCVEPNKAIESCPAAPHVEETFELVKHELRETASEILIPIGDTSHYEIVQLFTFFVTWAGSKFIYHTLLKNKPQD